MARLVSIDATTGDLRWLGTGNNDRPDWFVRCGLNQGNCSFLCAAMLVEYKNSKTLSLLCAALVGGEVGEMRSDGPILPGFLKIIDGGLVDKEQG
jgi:hypothetical protein